LTERQAATIYAAEYAAAVPEDIGRDMTRDMEQRRRSIAIKRLAAVCHDRRIIAKVSNTPLIVVRKWLGDESRAWPTMNQKGCK
jgi:hypothetical protein